MTEKEEEKAEPQICPILTLAEKESGVFTECLKEKCTLWVKGYRLTQDPFHDYAYEGCGLVSHLFWEKRERKP